ncbi:MAG TPA: hypothetical protein VFZ53_02280 [Polyangiaceae bacterium]
MHAQTPASIRFSGQAGRPRKTDVGIDSTHKNMKRRSGEEVKKETLKSIVAVIAGFGALAALSTITDNVFEKAGLMKSVLC